MGEGLLSLWVEGGISTLFGTSRVELLPVWPPETLCVLSGHEGVAVLLLAGGGSTGLHVVSTDTPFGPSLLPGSWLPAWPSPTSPVAGTRQDLMWVDVRLPTQPLLAWVERGHSFPVVFGWRSAVSVYAFSVLLGCLSPGPSLQTADFCGHVFVPMGVSALLASSAPHLGSRGKKKTWGTHPLGGSSGSKVPSWSAVLCPPCRLLCFSYT